MAAFANQPREGSLKKLSLRNARRLIQSLVSTTLFLATVGSVFGQIISWTRQFGTSGDDDALGVAVDGTSVYVVGRKDLRSAGLVDAFVRKYDASGTELWTRSSSGDQ